MEELLEIIEEVKQKRDDLDNYLEQLTKRYKLDRERPITLRAIMNIVMKYFDVTEESIKGRNRQSNIKNARHFFCYLSRKHTGKTLNEIGKYINKDHASVLHAAKQINHFIQNYDEEKLIVNALEYKITEYKFSIV